MRAPDEQIVGLVEAALALDPSWPGIDLDRGNCFSSAVHVTRALVSQGEDATLVHGAPAYRGGESRMAHAWVEVEFGGVTYAVDFSNRNRIVMPVAFYYAVGRIASSACLRYTYDEAVDEALETGHYGPWDESAFSSCLYANTDG